MRKKIWLRLLAIAAGLTLVVLGAGLGLVYWKQDSVVQELLAKANEDFAGEVSIEGSHISPFENFPYISIDLDHVRVFEAKGQHTEPLLDIEDVYLGFDVLRVIRGDFQISTISLSSGSIRLVQHTDGTFNIARALSPQKEVEDTGAEFHLDLQAIRLENIDILKVNEASGLVVEAFVEQAASRFKTTPDHTLVSLDSRFLMNIMLNGDTTFLHHKHFNVKTEFDFLQTTKVLTIQPSELTLENATFKMEGNVDLDDDGNLDIRFQGSKPNFDLFMAFAPPELAPVLQRYDNAGRIFFDARVSGKSLNGHRPLVVADFGCEDAFFNNRTSNKKLDQLYFKGHFTTGERGDLSTMEFSLLDFSARPEAGRFSGALNVRNFESPEIDMKLNAAFQLRFLADFLNLTDLQDLAGEVSLNMNFHDIIDLAHPERSIEKLNESYFTELEIKDLSFRLPQFHLPVRNLHVKATMDGHAAKIENASVRLGASDISLTATVSDLPAILHHTADPVVVDLAIASKLIDLKELTMTDSVSKPVDEQIHDLRMKFKFKSSAKAFTESPHLPVGEFFVDNLFAKLTHYPHTLHDFHADIFIDNEDFRVIDFTGMIDKSDFHFNGRLKNYDLWMSEQPKGQTRMEFNLNSRLLQLEDLFSYGGENYVPEDYRHEEFSNLVLHGFADLELDRGIKSIDVRLDRVEGKMKAHPLRLENFSGRVHYEDQHLMVDPLQGKIGKTQFKAFLNYYFGPDSIIRKRDNHFALQANHLDFDELFSYQPPPSTSTGVAVNHEDVFNIYDVPFSDMTFDFDIKHLNYHRYLIDDFFAKARTNRNHYIFIDTLSLRAAGGNIHLNGYFNGSNRNQIYFSPKLGVENVNLDQLLFKFENFGQDHLVSENLHGRLTGQLTGKIRMHADMVPIVDDSEIHMDLQVLEGRLENYGALHAMADFFQDKNLNRVRFDTLKNKFDLQKGVLTIPAMTINSTLGFLELSGKQDLNMNMEYYVRVPWKLVSQIASQQLFGGKQATPGQEDEIQYRDTSKRERFLNLRLTGTPDNFKIAVAKDKKAGK